MDYKAILDSWIGNTCQESSSLWYQCVALSKQFAKDIWNPIKWFSGSALKWWQTWSPFDDEWERVTYEKWKVPKLGEILQGWEKLVKEGKALIIQREQMEAYAQDVINKYELGKRGLDIEEQKLIKDIILGMLEIESKGARAAMGAKVGKTGFQ